MNGKNKDQKQNNTSKESAKSHFFDSPRNVKWFLRGFYFVLGVLVIIDFFVPKHGEFPWENVPDFFAVYGFASCVLLIFIAKGLRIIVKRDEDYYE